MGKATNFRFCKHIHRVDRNKSPLKISGKVAVGVLRDWKIFRAPIYRAYCAVIFAIAQLSCIYYTLPILSFTPGLNATFYKQILPTVDCWYTFAAGCLHEVGLLDIIALFVIILIYRVVQKTVPQFYFCDNFRKCTPILTIFSLLEPDIYDA